MKARRREEAGIASTAVRDVIDEATLHMVAKNEVGLPVNGNTAHLRR